MEGGIRDVRARLILYKDVLRRAEKAAPPRLAKTRAAPERNGTGYECPA